MKEKKNNNGYRHIYTCTCRCHDLVPNNVCRESKHARSQGSLQNCRNAFFEFWVNLWPTPFSDLTHYWTHRHLVCVGSRGYLVQHLWMCSDPRLSLTCLSFSSSEGEVSSLAASSPSSSSSFFFSWFTYLYYTATFADIADWFELWRKHGEGIERERERGRLECEEEKEESEGWKQLNLGEINKTRAYNPGVNLVRWFFCESDVHQSSLTRKRSLTWTPPLQLIWLD